MELDRIELIEKRFRKRYNTKKTVNIIITAVITLLGIVSVIYIWNYDSSGILTFRWMTVDGTIFTTIISFVYTAAGIIEILRYTEITAKPLYFARLASAVAEGLIIIVVLLSQMPVSPEKMHIFRFDMFNMHILIPILTILSFLLNDSPVGKLNIGKRFYGTWFVTLYGITIIILIVTGAILQEQIPYFFLDVMHMPVLSVIACFAFIYVLGYILSYCLSEGNRRLSWLWFKGIAKK